MTQTHEVTIDRRFRGPATSGNGGYCCGVIASALTEPGGPAVEATLRAPPPLDRALTVTVDGETAVLKDGDATMGTGKRSTLELEVPDPPALDEARAATAHYAGLQGHILPECFVCGTHREPGDGLRLFTGRVGERDLVAAPWTPSEDLGDANGRVRPEFMWAALDCPSYFGLLRPGLFALLGRMTAQVHELPKVGDDLIVVGWPIESDGRKHHAGSAVFGPSGKLLGHAYATWIELDPSRMPKSDG